MAFTPLKTSDAKANAKLATSLLQKISCAARSLSFHDFGDVLLAMFLPFIWVYSADSSQFVHPFVVMSVYCGTLIV